MNQLPQSPSRLQVALANCVYVLLLSAFLLVDCLKWLLSLNAVALNLRDKNKVKRDARWGQKFGLLPVNRPNPKGGDVLLIHCASVGEVVAALPLLTRLAKQQPELGFVVTTNTLTGKQQLQRSIANTELANKVVHNYLPIDLPGLMRRFIRCFAPRLVIIMEVEMWPNFIRQSHKLKVPVLVVNGRMTDKTCRGYQKFAWLSQPMLSSIDQIFARNAGDLNNYRTLGIDEQKLQLVGNIKFDIALPEQQDNSSLKQSLGLTERTVIVAGSTHESEEQILINAYRQLQSTYPELLLFITPRHPHRFAEVAEQIKHSQLNFVCTSQQIPVTKQQQVLLGDEMGKLSQWYAVADIVFVGGSLAPRGGHNPIEAAAYAKPILMGPHIYNNPEIVQTLADDDGLVLVNDEAELIGQLNMWLAQPEQAKSCGNNGLNTIKKNQGVVQKVVAYVSDHFIQSQ